MAPAHGVTSGFIQGFSKLQDHFREGNAGLHFINFSLGPHLTSLCLPSVLLTDFI